MSSRLVQTSCFSAGAVCLETAALAEVPLAEMGTFDVVSRQVAVGTETTIHLVMKSDWRFDAPGPVFLVMEGKGDLIPRSALDIRTTDTSPPLWSHVAGPHHQKTVFIRDLGDPRLSVRAAIPVYLEFWDGFITACCYDLEEFEVASDEFVVLDALKASIADLYFLLKSEQQRLGPLPQRQWDYLRPIIEERR